MQEADRIFSKKGRHCKTVTIVKRPVDDFFEMCSSLSRASKIHVCFLICPNVSVFVGNFSGVHLPFLCLVCEGAKGDGKAYPCLTGGSNLRDLWESRSCLVLFVREGARGDGSPSQCSRTNVRFWWPMINEPTHQCFQIILISNMKQILIYSQVFFVGV